MIKIKGEYLYSLAIGLAYLSALMIHPAYGMSNSIECVSNKTYAWYYIGKNLLKNWVSRPVYTYEKPFEIPRDLPTPQQLAQTIATQKNTPKFLRGASTSAHQYGKLCTPEICSWSRFAEQHNLIKPTNDQYQIDWDRHYKAYIDYAKDELKLNSLRFSIEWALVQPHNPERTDNKFDKNALNHYADIFTYMIKQGITPVVCFHHYTDPCWFIDGGGFEHPENIRYFTQFCTSVYRHIMQKVRRDADAVAALQTITPLWATYNAPGGYAFRGYRQNAGPPSIQSRSGLPLVAEVLKNMLEAHVQVYNSIKQSYTDMQLSQQTIATPQIGFLKNIHQIDPAHKTWMQYFASPITRFLVSFADMIQNGAVYNFFTTGTFQVHIPFVANIKHTNPNARNSLDFIGLNYYANRHMMLTQGLKPTDSNTCSDNEWYYRYPQGMYRAIVELSENIAHQLNIPLLVAENGIATTDHYKRAQFYHEYLYAIAKAVQDGYSVCGYLPWTLADNYEWPSLKDNKKQEYGLCSVPTPDTLQAKEGSRPYLEFVQRLHQLEQTNSI